jgi:hypothetical protein
VIREMFLLCAKKLAQSHGEWDLLEVAQAIPGDEAFRPLLDAGCPLVGLSSRSTRRVGGRPVASPAVRAGIFGECKIFFLNLRLYS